ncbi:MAG: 50S ribosomal protein L35 [Calditrichaeota bacterium]|nr:50S ribosomal protein L35 [Calditrichota bacterium]MCB9368142.1 50S ribosomal protein L35 [Calditrichota bacterium]
MPKMKTKRSMAKRCKVTGSGKIVFYKTRRRHKLTHKTAAHKNRLTGTVVFEGGEETKVKRMMAMA